MMRLKTKFLIGLGLLVIAFLPEIFAQSSSRRKVYSNRWYFMKRGEHGYVHIVHKDSGDNLAPVLFLFEYVMKERSRSLMWDMKLYCKNDSSYTPVKVEAEVRENVEGKKSSILIDSDFVNGETHLKYISGTKRSKSEEEELIAGIKAYGVMVLTAERVCNLPFEGKVDMELPEQLIGQKYPITFKYGGLKEVEIDGQKFKLHQFRQEFDGVGRAWFWINEQHELICWVPFEDMKLILSSEKEVKKGLK